MDLWESGLPPTVTRSRYRDRVMPNIRMGSGLHASRSADRFEALEPVRQGVRERFGAFGKNVATGLALRHDHGSQYVSHHFQAEIRFLGIASSPAFVREPEGNGCAERFIRVLKENLLL